MSIALLGGTTALLAALGVAEGIRHRRQLARIPKRIHVNGTRGKSSVTRLIAAGLRAAGLRLASLGQAPVASHPLMQATREAARYFRFVRSRPLPLSS